MLRTATLLALSFTPLAHAQGLLVVDASNGPGTDFTDIPPAVAAAAPGDRIAVRAGTYNGFVVSKALSICGEPGVVVISPNPTGTVISILDTAAGTDVVLRALDLFSLGGAQLSLKSCRGRVLLDEIEIVLGGAITVEDCAQVLINRSDLGGPSPTFARSTVTLTQTTCTGGFNAFAPGPGLFAIDADLWLSRCSITGGSVFGNSAPPGVGVDMTNSRVTITGIGDAGIRAGSSGPGFPAPAIQGSGTLTIDPDVVLAPHGAAPAVQPPLVATFRDIPSLAVAGASLGDAISAELQSEVDDLYLLLIGLPGDAIPFPALQGSIWIDPATLLVAQSGSIPPSGMVTLAVTLPLAQNLVGVPITWLGVAGPDLPSLALSNNAAYSHSL